jgi:hypothetical protein
LQSGATVLGTVLNGISSRHEQSQQYYYPRRERPHRRFWRWPRGSKLAFLQHGGAASATVDSPATTMSLDSVRAPESDYNDGQSAEKARADATLAIHLVPIAQELNGKFNQHNGDTT